MGSKLVLFLSGFGHRLLPNTATADKVTDPCQHENCRQGKTCNGKVAGFHVHAMHGPGLNAARFALGVISIAGRCRNAPIRSRAGIRHSVTRARPWARPLLAFGSPGTCGDGRMLAMVQAESNIHPKEGNGRRPFPSLLKIAFLPELFFRHGASIGVP